MRRHRYRYRQVAVMATDAVVYYVLQQVQHNEYDNRNNKNVELAFVEILSVKKMQHSLELCFIK